MFTSLQPRKLVFRVFRTLFLWSLIAVTIVTFFTFTATFAQAISLDRLAQGQVIQIQPQTGTYMCGDSACSTNGAAAEPYKLMYTGVVDDNGTSNSTLNDDAAYFVMLDNYCAWRSADCTTSNGSKSWSMSSWNGDSTNVLNCNIGDTSGSCNDLGGSRKTINILQPLENFYNSLPTSINNLTKSQFTFTKAHDVRSVNYITGTNTASYQSGCSFSTNATPYGNAGATFDNSTCTWNSRVTLLSYDDWMGKSGDLPWALGRFPTTDSIGFAYCLSRFDTADCSNNGQYNFFTSHAFKQPFRSLTRTTRAEGNTWNISASSATIFMGGTNGSGYSAAVMPALYLSTNLCTTGAGTGTYASPFDVSACDFSTQQTPLITLIATQGNSGQGVTITGYTNLITLSTDIKIWADVCNTLGDCVRKEIWLNTGNPATTQNFTLEWGSSELPAGQYEGAIWVGASTDSLYQSVQSNSISFSNVSSQTPVGQPLTQLTQGTVIQIHPQVDTTTEENNYMCSDQNCSGNGGAAEPYKLMYIGTNDANSAYFVMMDNYCAWRSADCMDYEGNRNWYGSAWNGDSNIANVSGSEEGYHNDLGGARKSINVLQPLEKFYNSLPNSISNIAKTDYIPTKSFDVNPVNSIQSVGAASYGVCGTSTNITPYGNTGAIFNNSSCTWTSKIALLSYDEWLGKSGSLPWGYSHQPTAGTIGSVFCLARFGTADCTNNANYDLFYMTNGTIKAPYVPWTRVPYGGLTTYTWRVTSNSATTALGANGFTYIAGGILPSLHLSSSLCTTGPGNGSYASPYDIDACGPQMGLQITETNWNEATGELVVAGNVDLKIDNQNINLWADVCNTQGNCLRKEIRVNSGSPAELQNFSLTWNSGELPPGQYMGTIWVGASSNSLYQSAQSSPISFIIPPKAELTLAQLQQGQVIQIPPKLDETTPSNNYMCSDQNCSGNGGAAEPYKLMYTGTKDSDSAYFVMLDNYCAWRSADCKDYSGYSSWSQSIFNSTFNSSNAEIDCTADSTTGNCNDIGGSRKPNHILQQLENFYNSLPNQIGMLNKSQALMTKDFDVKSIDFPEVAEAGGYGEYNSFCHITTNSTPYGNSGHVFNGDTCTWTSKVSLLSYDEWQGSTGVGLPWGLGHAPEQGTIGSTFCQTRFGTSNCDGTGNTAGLDQYTLFIQTETLKGHYQPTVRSFPEDATNRTWSINAAYDATWGPVFMGTRRAYGSAGVVPALHLSSELCLTDSGLGTYASPYSIGECIAPLALSVTTTVWDDDTQTLTITGSTQVEKTDADINVWASVCNINNDCLRKEVTLNSGGSAAAQPFTLSWSAAELPSGIYSGTIWINANSGGVSSAVQTDQVDFAVNARVLKLNVVFAQPFNLEIGNAVDLTPGTSQNVAVTRNDTTGYYSIAGTLTQNTAITFGATTLDFTVISPPQPQVQNLNLR